MSKTKHYLYGDFPRLPNHLNFGKKVYSNMLKNKDKTALMNADTRSSMTYYVAAKMTADVARKLTGLGVRNGDVVCICSENNLEYLPTVMGIICAGATFSPMDPTYGSCPLMDRLIVASPKVMFCSLAAYETYKQTFDDVGSIQCYILYGNERKDGAVLFKDLRTGIPSEKFKPVSVNGCEDVAVLLFSSGTTKRVSLTHLRLLSDSQNMLVTESKGVGVYSSGAFYSPFSLVYALSCLIANATIVFNKIGGEKNMLEAVQKYKLRVLQLSPKDVIELTTSAILDSYDVSSVELVVATGTHIWDETVRAIEQRFPNPVMRCLRQYWTNEIGVICHEQFDTRGCRSESAGRPANGVVIKVVDLETRELVDPFQRGEICVKGYWALGFSLEHAWGWTTRVVSHWKTERRHIDSPDCAKNFPDCAKNAIPNLMDEEGFLKTGDIGYYDHDGCLYFVNRIKDFIKFNGIDLAPATFEALLIQHRSVREAAVVGKINRIHGAVPVAFVVLKPGRSASEEELVEHVNSDVPFNMRLAGGVCFVEQLPLNHIGKICRKDLVHRLLEEDRHPFSRYPFPFPML